MEAHIAADRMLPSIPESMPGADGGISIFRRVIDWHLKHPGHVPDTQCEERAGGAVATVSNGGIDPRQVEEDSESAGIWDHCLTEPRDDSANKENAEIADHVGIRDLLPNTESPGQSLGADVNDHALRYEARYLAQTPDLTSNIETPDATPSSKASGTGGITEHTPILDRNSNSTTLDHAEKPGRLDAEPSASNAAAYHGTSHGHTKDPISRTADVHNVPAITYGDIHYYAPLAASAPRATDLELILGTANADTRRLPIHDLRGREAEFKLDGCGFQLVHHGSLLQRSDFESDAVIKSRYHPELEAIVRSLYPAAVEIIQLGCILRGALPRADFSGDAGADPAWNKPDRSCAPATRAHVDFTGKGVRLVLEQLWEGEGLDETTAHDRAADLGYSGRRFVALSLWRPLRRVRRDPLAFCDGRTVGEGEKVNLERAYPDGRKGENVVIRAGEEGREHEWYWVSGQDVEEMVVLKLYDSEGGKGGVVGGTPHSSFHLEGSEGEEVRESVEGRVVVCL